MGKKQAEACTPTVIMFGLCRRGMLVRGNSAVDAEFIVRQWPDFSFTPRLRFTAKMGLSVNLVIGFSVY